MRRKMHHKFEFSTDILFYAISYLYSIADENNRRNVDVVHNLILSQDHHNNGCQSNKLP
jgi:hypothetical protein